MRRIAAALLVALVLAGCGGSDATTYESSDVEQAFRDAGLPLRRLTSVGAEQPAMGETAACATHYLVRSARGEMVNVFVCEGAEGAELTASDSSMSRSNVAVQYSGYDTEVHEQIDRALDGLGS